MNISQCIKKQGIMCVIIFKYVKLLHIFKDLTRIKCRAILLLERYWSTPVLYASKYEQKTIPIPRIPSLNIKAISDPFHVTPGLFGEAPQAC